MTIRAEVISGVRWAFGARLLAQVATWAVTLVVIRILAPADYGLLAMATVFVAFTTMFSDFGLASAAVQDAAIDETGMQRIFGMVLASHGLAILLLQVAAPWIAAYFGEPRLENIVRVLSLQFVPVAFAVMPDVALQRRLDFRRRSVVDLIGAVIGSLTTLLLAVSGAGVWSLIAGSLTTQLWKAVCLNVIAPFPRRPRFTIADMRHHLVFGGRVTLSQAMWLVFSQADVFIAGRFLDKEQIGFYSVALHLASLPNQRIAGVINQIAFPAFARLQHDLAAVGRHTLAGVRLMSIIAFPLLWGLSSVAPELVRVVLGVKWEPSVVVLQILGIVMPLRMIANFVPNAIQGIGRSDIMLNNAIWSLVLYPLGFFVGVRFGLIGLALAWLVMTPVSLWQAMARSLPAIQLTMREFLRACAPSAAAGAAMYAAVVAARMALPGAVPLALRLALLVAVGAIVYVLASLAVNRSGVKEAREVARMVLGRRRSGKAAADES